LLTTMHEQQMDGNNDLYNSSPCSEDSWAMATDDWSSDIFVVSSDVVAGGENETGTATKEMREKLKSFYKKMRYSFFLKRPASFDSYSPIWLLGKQYAKNEPRPNLRRGFDENSAVGKLSDFLEDFKTRIWFTYRHGFACIPGTNFDNDCGWGCTIRSGQMLLAETMLRHYLGRDWLLGQNGLSDDEALMHRKVIGLFCDNLTSPFSLHNLVHVGQQLFGKQAGSWYGPVSVLQILQVAMNNAIERDLVEGLAVHVVGDGELIIDDVERLGCGLTLASVPRRGAENDSADRQPRSSSYLDLRRLTSVNNGDLLPSHDAESIGSTEFVDETRSWSRGVLVLLPLRLGVDKFNQLYSDHLKRVLSTKFCVGVIGGRHHKCYYFCGWHTDYLIRLDPHYSQPAVDATQPGVSLQSFHCKYPKKTLIADIDPWCSIGFYIRNRLELQSFLADISEAAAYGCSSPKHPLFTILSSRNEKHRTPIRMSTSYLASVSNSTKSTALQHMTGSREYIFA
ncbi:Cysteine protease ATG4C, partial [Trichinella pseudospiralis]